MGSCVSRSTASPLEGSGRAVATAKVVGQDGSLAQFAAPVTAGEALGDAARAPSFMCSADELRFDAPARALAAEEALQPGWLYFALPMSMLRRPLSGQEMAALAVKASSALAVADGKGRKAARVAPLVVAEESAGTEDGGWSHHAYGKGDALKTVHGGGETVGKTRKRAGGSYGSGTSRPASVQRLSSILEADD
ncbi:hypothetical protein CFC21_078254 [Triticum aestivum]|uniref:Uncharacterized protein n=3 Tax=Triticinae TaxID=1648030 RepID=A0A453L4Z4_AEGTS|nr:uncharacterized protein LOC109750921 [Aegilops tauschii subsp. strangulata]XP_044401503.1 uncharacterized protein LOC123125026 [Triticum aestivum]KAF7073222.1 hypothetical protein CFC21_078254 [Triticum aestivum]